MISTLFALCISVYGLVLLLTGRPLTGGADRKSGFRWLGVFLLTIIPAMLLGSLCAGVAVSLFVSIHDAPSFDRAFRTVNTVATALVAAIYVFVMLSWTKSLQASAVSANPSQSQGD